MSSKPITVGALKALFNNIPDETPIIISRDEEGNGFHYAIDVEQVCVTNPGEYYLDIDYESEEVNAILLWP